MKKEIERLNNQYKDILKGKEIYYEMEKSDPYDNRSPRCYRVAVAFELNDIICEYGLCKHKESILERFENKLKERK